MAGDAINWMVPLRRAVIKEAVSYHDFLQAWLEQLRDTDNSFILGIWYTKPQGKALRPADYDRGVGALRRWLQVTFDGPTKVATSSVGITTLQTHVPNFHARLWKGPKRILLEQRAKNDPDKLAELQPFDLNGGRIELRRDEQGNPKDVPLYPGDVLEIALHEFLAACGQADYGDVEFDPMGSFYLGTTVKSKSGRARVELPRLHDNMLAMRFQLITALNMANCYHDEPVYTDTLPVKNPKQLRPEGGGVFARGMPFGGNASAAPKTNPQLHWQVSQLQTNLPKTDLPVYLPTHASLLHYADGLPLTWGWTCTPFTLLYFNLMADSHQTHEGLLLSGEFRGESLARSLCLSTSKKNNEEQLMDVHEFQAKNGDDPLLLHNLELSDIQLPREQTPLADLCEVVFPEGRSLPEGRPFTDPDKTRMKWLKLPLDKTTDTHDWNDLCPGAGVIVVSSADGHEYGLTKLHEAKRILEDAKAALAKGDLEAAPLPVAGCLSAYNPLTGEDYCSGADTAAGGHFFVNESGAKMVPKNRGKYLNLQLAEVRLHKFQPTPGNKAKFRTSDDKELQIADTGGDFRKKQVSAIFYIREGKEGDTDPRTLANIYAIPRESWIPIALSYPSTPYTIAGFESLYAQRAVPFPTILEIAAEMPSRARVAQQLANHLVRLEALQKSNAEVSLKKELAKLDLKKSDKARLERDLAFVVATDDQGNRKWKVLHEDLIALVSASAAPSPKDEDDE
jgi:hypothetical protein